MHITTAWLWVIIFTGFGFESVWIGN